MKFCKLKPVERRLLLEAALRLTVTRAGLRLRPLRAWRRAPAVQRAKEPRPDPAKLAWAVETAARVVPGATCLAQALAGRQLFASRGYAAIVRIGVRQSGQTGFAAHAWLEHEGTALPAGEGGAFTPILSL